MHKWPPQTLYDTLHTLKVPGSPYWKYDGQFIWLPMPQTGYEKYRNARPKTYKPIGHEVVSYTLGGKIYSFGISNSH